MARLDLDRQKELEPKRMEFAKREITKLGYDIIFESTTQLQFRYKGKVVAFFPFSGWATGSSIKDGRGLKNLLKQIKP